MPKLRFSPEQTVTLQQTTRSFATVVKQQDAKNTVTLIGAPLRSSLKRGFRGQQLAYRINARFKDGSTNGPMADIVIEAPPHCGDTLSVSRRGQRVSVRVTAVWTPSLPPSNRVAETLIVVEAREI